MKLTSKIGLGIIGTLFIWFNIGLIRRFECISIMEDCSSGWELLTLFTLWIDCLIVALGLGWLLVFKCHLDWDIFGKTIDWVNKWD